MDLVFLSPHPVQKLPAVSLLSMVSDPQVTVVTAGAQGRAAARTRTAIGSAAGAWVTH